MTNCTICNKPLRFWQAHTATAHEHCTRTDTLIENTITAPESTGELTCPKCPGRTFKKQQHLNQHTKTHEPKEHAPEEKHDTP